MKIHMKKGDESLFLYETSTDTCIDNLLKDVVAIYNGRNKVDRLCAEISELADHGITLPPNMQGLTEEQLEELKLNDEWVLKCPPSGGSVLKKDDIGRRNGHAPNEQMAAMMKKTITEAKTLISKDNIKNNTCVTQAVVKEALDILRGAATIVYPMGLPPHDPIRMEFDNNENLEGQQASLDVIDEPAASVWFSGKEMLRGKKICDFAGKNEKTKIIVKLQKKGQGPPSREPVVSETDQRAMVAYYYKKQEDFKKLEAESDDSYMDSAWADSKQLKRSFQGLRDINWGPR